MKPRIKIPRGFGIGDTPAEVNRAAMSLRPEPAIPVAPEPEPEPVTEPEPTQQFATGGVVNPIPGAVDYLIAALRNNPVIQRNRVSPEIRVSTPRPPATSDWSREAHGNVSIDYSNGPDYTGRTMFYRVEAIEPSAWMQYIPYELIEDRIGRGTPDQLTIARMIERDRMPHQLLQIREVATTEERIAYDTDIRTRQYLVRLIPATRLLVLQGTGSQVEILERALARARADDRSTPSAAIRDLRVQRAVDTMDYRGIGGQTEQRVVTGVSYTITVTGSGLPADILREAALQIQQRS